MIDPHTLNIGASVWFKGTECAVIHLQKIADPNISYPKIKIIWTVGLIDIQSYREEFEGAELDRTTSRILVNTGNHDWNAIKEDCSISNAIDFIRGSV